MRKPELSKYDQMIADYERSQSVVRAPVQWFTPLACSNAEKEPLEFTGFEEAEEQPPKPIEYLKYTCKRCKQKAKVRLNENNVWMCECYWWWYFPERRARYYIPAQFALPEPE